MKKLLTALLLVGALALPGFAEPSPAPVKTMIDYKAELKLSDEQIAKIRATVKEFGQQLGAERTKLEAAEKQVAADINGHAPLPTIGQHLRVAEDLRMNLRYLDVVTSRTIEGILTPQQLNGWHTIQAQIRAQSQSKGSKP